MGVQCSTVLGSYMCHLASCGRAWVGKRVAAMAPLLLRLMSDLAGPLALLPYTNVSGKYFQSHAVISFTEFRCDISPQREARFSAIWYTIPLLFLGTSKTWDRNAFVKR